MKALKILLPLALLLLGYYQLSRRQLSPAVLTKEAKLATELKKSGYRACYVPISGYRPEWLNHLLPLAAKKSAHRHGQAMDILVLDINGDWRVNRTDVKLVVAALERIDARERALVGGLGTYFKSTPLMVHFDTNGRKRRWNY